MEQPQRIKIWMGWALIITALCVDLAELAITWIGVVAIGGLLSNILAVVAGFGFFVWFSLLGVNSSGNTKELTKKVMVQGGAFLAELIPGFDAIPFLSWAWTAGMIITVIMTRMEDNGEKATITGALQKMTTLGSLNPATYAIEGVKNSVRKRTFRKPQKRLEPAEAGGTM
jgi:hypothetical protein